MLAQDYLEFTRLLELRGVIFSYSGYVSESILFSLGDALKQKMALDETDVNTTKKVFSIFVEQVQNVIRYSADRLSGAVGREPQRKVELSSGMIAIGSDPDGFFVICGNVVMQQDVARLRERLTALKGMGRDEIKAFYKEKLKEGPEAESKGASIGLIEIARRASAPIDFDFATIDAERTFFCLKAKI